MAERYTAEWNEGEQCFELFANGKFFALIDYSVLLKKKSKEEQTQFIARALNAYAALEQVKSIGEANKEKENE